MVTPKKIWEREREIPQRLQSCIKCPLIAFTLPLTLFWIYPYQKALRLTKHLKFPKFRCLQQSQNNFLHTTSYLLLRTKQWRNKSLKPWNMDTATINLSHSCWIHFFFIQKKRGWGCMRWLLAIYRVQGLEPSHCKLPLFITLKQIRDSSIFSKIHVLGTSAKLCTASSLATTNIA